LGANATLLWNFNAPVQGYDASGGGWLPVGMDTTLIPSALAGSDVVAIRTTRQGQPVFRTTAAVTSVTAALQVTGSSATAVPVNTPMIVSDCSGAAVFMATGFSAGPPVTIAHALGAGTGNASADLPRGGFGIGSVVIPIQTVVYYVRNSVDAAVGPTLWQKVGNSAPQELVQGVENLQLRYGVDTDDDLLVNEYRVASAVTDWRKVVSLSMAVLVRSPDEAGVERDNRTYNLLGTTFGPFNDRRQRAVFTTTVVLRNRTS
jgi:type IV pilus assembly protein PilW